MSQFNQKIIAREFAMKYLYQLDLEKIETLHAENKENVALEGLNEFHQSFIQADDEHPDNLIDGNHFAFAKNLIVGSVKNYTELKAKIVPFCSRDISKMDKMNLCILALAIYESQYVKDTPKAVIINEYINMAKRFSSPDSHQFVNSVLDKAL